MAGSLVQGLEDGLPPLSSGCPPALPPAHLGFHSLLFTLPPPQGLTLGQALGSTPASLVKSPKQLLCWGWSSVLRPGGRGEDGEKAAKPRGCWSCLGPLGARSSS